MATEKKVVKAVRKTREELIAELAAMGQTAQSWSNAADRERHNAEVEDRRRRDKFTKILGCSARSYSMTVDSPVLSWEEIFCEMGKLLADTRSQKFGTRLELVETRLSNIENPRKDGLSL